MSVADAIDLSIYLLPVGWLCLLALLVWGLVAVLQPKKRNRYVRPSTPGHPRHASALAQPAEGEDIMVSTPYGAFILPLRPSGLDGKGPRFVVHVPAPEQQPARPGSGEVVEAVGYENEDGTLFGYANHKAYERNPGAIPVRIMRATDYDRMQSALAAAQERIAELEAQVASLPADWSKDSSLQTWFPFTAQELTAAQQRYADGLEAWKANNAHFAARIAELREAGQAVVDRWDTPLWKDVPATAEYIARLRAALSAQRGGECP